jgi:hypothetical protein
MKFAFEMEQYLAPLLKKVEFFEQKKTKDHVFNDIAYYLKYEYYPKNTAIHEQGKNFFIPEK